MASSHEMARPKHWLRIVRLVFSRPQGNAKQYRRRRREILSAVIRHGLGVLVGTRGYGRLVPFHWGLLGYSRRAVPYTRAEHVRLAIEDLGPTFIKIGQIASTRGDLLPPEYQLEFARLQDAAPPEPLEVIRETVETDLGDPPETIFAHFEDVPLAAASIGQVHAATLTDGTEVVVKIRRPGVTAHVERDLEILGQLAETAVRRWDRDNQYDIPGLAAEFSDTLRHELDYRREAENARRFAEHFTADEGVIIPRVHREFTTSRVLTLDRMRGMKIDDLAALDTAGIDRSELARRAADLTLTMVFEHGFFHADPHPGNFFVQTDGSIALIDFGMVGVVDHATRTALATALVATTTHNTTQLIDAFASLGVTSQTLEREQLTTDLEQLMDEFLTRPLNEIEFGALLQDHLTIMRRHGLRLPPTLALLAKTIAMSEGVAARIDPSFQILPVLAPYAQRLVAPS
ncbi:MAG: AarF/ABC1/UbiB kinase family protein [Acidimicrobiia bacterium]|nr:AarF/ABC1/UbiB kinase family protein [Acidimicrobiia bacterium]